MKTEYVPREVIDKKLLAALNDENKAACLFEKADLELLIAALRRYSIEAWAIKADEMADDLTKLRNAAFKP